MKQLYIFLVSVLAVLGLVACTADYDEFGTSHYNVFKNIAFEEQDGDASFSESEHIIKITTVAPAESLETWDSLTIGYISASNLATLHLVDGKFKEFPSDSAGLDSLAQEVSYVKKSLKAGDKIRIPKSQVVYVMLVAENGDPAIWKIEFTIPGVEKEESSSSAGSDDSEKSSSSEGEGDSAESSSSVAAEQSSSSIEIAKNDDNSFKIKFVDELDNKTSGDTVYVTFAQGTELAKVVVDSTVAFINRLAKIDVDPKSVKDWSVVQTFKVTAENDSVKTWIVVVDAVKNSATNLTLKFKNQISTSTKNGDAADTISIKLKSDETLETAKIDTCILSSGAKIAPNPSEVESWAESQNFKVTAEDGTERTWVLLLSIAAADYVASSEKELVSISATGEVSAATVNAENKTVVLHMASKDAMADVAVTIKVSDLASATLASKDLRTPQKLTITAEDGSDVEWTVSADYPKSSAAEILSFELDGLAATIAPAIDAEKRTISFEVAYGTDLSEVFFKASVSEAATLTTNSVNLSEGKAKVVVTAEDGSTQEWMIVATVAAPPVVKVAPRIRSMKIAGQTAVVDSVKEDDKWVHWVHYDNMTFLADLTNLAVSDIELSEGASISGIEDGSSYDLSRGKKVTVSMGDDSQEYEIRAGYQLPNSNFDAISYDDVWNNANQTIKILVTIKVVTAESVNIGSGKGVKLKTDEKASKIASGSIYTADFNPNSVQAISLASTSDWPDGNELIDFGKKFNARPRYIEFLASYEGKGDSCDIYLVLENRTGDKNVNRTSTDVNKMVASAWYRSTSMKNDGRPNPDVVAISEPDANGMTRIRMKVNYGKPLENSPIYNSSAFETTVQSKTGKAINNGMIQGTGDEPVTHIRMVFASSGDGQHYKGSVGATLIVDEIRFIY